MLLLFISRQEDMAYIMNGSRYVSLNIHCGFLSHPGIVQKTYTILPVAINRTVSSSPLSRIVQIPQHQLNLEFRRECNVTK
jgi:hypothetical protein